MKNEHYAPEPNLVERIAVHLTDFPLNKPCAGAVASDQLLNDVLNHLSLLYQGAYSDFSPPVPLIASPQIDQ